MQNINFSMKLITTLFLNLSLLTPYTMSHAAESGCGVMSLMAKKSYNTDIQGNTCSKNSIGIDTKLTLKPEARLWLQEINQNNTSLLRQLICQNKSNNNIELQLNKSEPPWIKVATSQVCNEWSNNKLLCTDTANNTASLYCIQSSLKIHPTQDNKKMERTTSVKVRSLLTSNLQVSIPLTDFSSLSLGEEVSLCRDLYQDIAPITASWHLDSDATVKHLKVKPNRLLRHKPHFINCVESVINAYPFPNSLQNLDISQAY